jgi:hypothetical protein
VAWRRKPSSLYVARLIETERPELKNALLTFVELVSDPSADPSMTVAVGRRAAMILARDVPRRFLPPWDLRRPLVAIFGAGALVGGMLWLAQGTRIRPWVASAEGGLMGVAIAPDQPASKAPPPAPPKPGPSDDSQNTTNETAEHSLAGAGGATKAPAAKASPAEAKTEASVAQELAGALQADAKAFERLAAALAADGTSGRQGEGAGGGRTGATDGPNGPEGGGSGDPPRDTPVSRGTHPAHAVDDAGMSPRPQGAGRTEPSPDAGGAPGSETADPRAGGGAAGTKPRKAAGDSPLPDREPSDRFPENALDAMRQAKRLIEEADRRLRDGKVTDTFLGRMGVGNAEFRRFVVAWQRRLDAAAGTGAVGHRPREVRSAAGEREGETLRPAGGTEATPIVGSVNVESDGRKGSVQGASPQVSPRLQPAVKAYFEAIDQLTAEPGGKEPTQ